MNIDSVPSVMEYKCYYYIERDKERDKLILFLLCPLGKMDSVYFSEGISTKETWNILMENDQKNKHAPILTLGKKLYAFKKIILEEDCNKKEIVIHSYIAKGAFIMPSEVSILINGKDKLPSPKISKPDEIAFNKPYVYVHKSQFKEQEKSTSRLKFYPRVLIPLLGYRLSKDKDMVDSIENVDKKEHKNYTAIIPLVKTRSKGITMVEPTDLNVNKSHYFDTQKIDGYFEVITSYLKTTKDDDEFREIEDFEKRRAFALQRATDVAGRYPGFSSDAIPNRPRSKAADIIPASGIFIDVP